MILLSNALPIRPVLPALGPIPVADTGHDVVEGETIIVSPLDNDRA